MVFSENIDITNHLQDINSKHDEWIFFYNASHLKIESNSLSYVFYPTHTEYKKILSLQDLNICNMESINYCGYIGYETCLELENYSLETELKYYISMPEIYLLEMGYQEVYSNITLTNQEYVLPKAINIYSNMCYEDYKNKLEIIRKNIIEGNLYQANLTRKICIEYDQEIDESLALSIFIVLANRAPTANMCFFKTQHGFILSASPESFIDINSKGHAITKPIKGTASIGQEDVLLNDKNKAENLMIVDLMRNDFSRVSNNVFVSKLFEIEEYRSLLQLYSQIECNKKHTISNVDFILHAFPAGSMTGAPKISAIQLCLKLESYKRGVYSGILCAFLSDNTCFSSVVIRTIIIQDNKIEFQVGGGITYDSDAEDEFNETILKAIDICHVLNLNPQILKEI